MKKEFIVSLCLLAFLALSVLGLITWSQYDIISGKIIKTGYEQDDGSYTIAFVHTKGKSIVLKTDPETILFEEGGSIYRRTEVMCFGKKLKITADATKRQKEFYRKYFTFDEKEEIMNPERDSFFIL